ncbi:hypothetical protein U6A24_15605 [Aquimarina gracilis]|uniref:DoxX-like protein n=1 Tax=Aquimarina gracilis TaxID=874422 RepID=A0ABU5ZYC4_9FLAO|nr:hypothetical protein [Aquimarina gracilis]MEB3346899.1 hypothetical protein [Aquimarina gracilis]
MKFGPYLYPILRILFGAFLVLTSIYDAIRYSGFLNRLDRYFERVSIFDLEFLEAFAPLVPFEKFVIGFFMILGMFKKKVLKISLGLFGFFTLFLLDASYQYCALIHFGFFITSLILLKNDNDNLSSFDHKKNFYQAI